MVEGTVEWSQIFAFSPSCLTVIGVYRYVCKIIVLKAHWVCKKSIPLMHAGAERNIH